MNKNCCLNCSKRFIGCHCICDRYGEYKEYLEHIKKKRKLEQDKLRFSVRTLIRN